jgi:DNA-binding transcriptional ArsR family regulator
MEDQLSESKVEINLTEEDAAVARRLLYQLILREDPAGEIAELGLHALASALHDAAQARREFFPRELFADPAWDIMLGLYCAHGRGEKINVTTLGQSVGLAQTTSLRWVKELANTGLVERIRDPRNRRRVFVNLTALAYEKMTLWLGQTRDRFAADLPRG